jgi:multiple sugar transport system permease protein
MHADIAGSGAGPLNSVRAKPRWQRELARNATAYLFLLPALVLFATFLWWPIVSAFIISFQEVDLRNEPSWVGLDNYREVLNDPLFRIAWRNTLTFTALALIFAFLLPLALAIAINEMRWRGFFRFAFYLPTILPAIVTVILWRWLFDPGPGLANTALGWIGLGPFAWLQARDSVLPSILIMTTWGGVGGTILFYLAGLQGIPATLYDAAELDGAGLWRRTRDITLPHMRGIMWLFLIGQVIGTMQLFVQPFAMTDGGPNNASLTIMLLLYRYAFEYNEFGRASAMGVLLFLFLSILSIFYLRKTFFRRDA